MYITGWTVALAALGAIPAALTQSRAIAMLWIAGVVVVACADALMAPHPSRVAFKRSVPASVRLTEATKSTISVANLSNRTVRGALRDAWQPSAGPTFNRHRFALAGLQTERFETHL